MDKEEGLIICTEELLQSIFRKIVTIRSIGHEELGRNSVYYIPEYDVILKLYKDKRRWEREVASLTYLNGKKSIRVPCIINYGVFQERNYWILIEKLEGINLSDVICDLDESHRLDIHKEVGSLQAAFHKECAMDVFGDWDINGNIVDVRESYFLYAKEKNNKQAKKIISKGYPDTKLFITSAEKLSSLEYTIKDCNEKSLCHNDLTFRNILVDNKYNCKIKGIIDFEKCYPSDPETDLTPMYLYIYMKKEMDYFLNGYTKVRTLSNTFDDKMKYYLIGFCLEVCSWSYNVNINYYHRAKEMLEYLINK